MAFVVFLIYTALSLLTVNATANPSSLDWKVAYGWSGAISDASSIGTPINSTTADGLTTRSAGVVGGIYMCSEAHWAGTCGYAVHPLNTCIVLGDNWNNQISSMGPDAGTLVIGYDNPDCAQAVLPLLRPGSGDLAALGWDNRISSFQVNQFS